MIELCAICSHNKSVHMVTCVDGCTCPGFVTLSDDLRQTCPRRMGEIGPWEHRDNLDFWTPSRWNQYYSSRWPEEFNRPQSCTFCGCVHPDDAIALLERGWEVESAKMFKWHLNPPGTQKYISSSATSVILVIPIPPVKLYGAHLSSVSAATMNEIIRNRSENDNSFQIKSQH